jgi:hypothetical protein
VVLKAPVDEMSDLEEETCRTQDTLPGRPSGRVALRGILPGDALCEFVPPSGLVLGRDAQCDVRLDYPRVSRRHAEVRAQGPLLVLQDLGSTNGTYVDGARVSRSVLEPGMLVRLGDFLGVVEEVESSERGRSFSELAPGIWGGALLGRAVAALSSVARSNLPIVLVGPTGSGKERFARALHAESGRGGGFHALNCAALSENLAESELFGHEKGAFTGAERAHPGRLRAVQGGTLLLDEVAELPLSLQAKLLRAIELKEVTPVGHTRSVAFDARIVAACQRPLSELVELGAFRRDLATRLSGMVVDLPALKARRADVPALFWHFVRGSAGARLPAVSTRLYESLSLYDWPGNVRELELLARRLTAANEHEPVLRRSHLPPEFPRAFEARSEDPRAARVGLEELTAALAKTQGNVRDAAALVGMSRQRAYRLITSRKLGGFVAAARSGHPLERHDSSERD